jgi:FkbM family methyltransferase
MTKVSQLVWLSKRNFIIDYKFITRITYLSFKEKLAILMAKYFTLSKHWFVKYQTAESKVTVAGKNIYYNTPYGLVGYECMMAEQIYWLTQLNISAAPVVVDVGANVGYFSMAVKKLRPGALVYSFEPAQVAYQALQRNLSEDIKTCHLFNIALGETSEQIGFFTNTTETSFSHVDNATPIKVQMKRLDDIVELQNTAVDVLKIDTEGYELEVLRGALNTLAHTKYLLMELNCEAYTLSDVTEILHKANKRAKLLYIRNFALASDTLFENGDVLFELVD